MNKYFVITSNVSYDHEGTNTSIIGVRFCNEDTVKKEVEELTKHIKQDPAGFVSYFFTYEEAPIQGYVNISIPMNDIELQKNSFYSNLSEQKMLYMTERFNRETGVVGVLFKDYFIANVKNNSSYDLLTEEDFSTLYDKYIENNVDKIIEII